MNKLNDRILNHRVLRKLIEMNLISQSEVRRLIMEETPASQQQLEAIAALKNLIAQAKRHNDPKKTIVDKKYHKFMPKHLQRIKALGGVKKLGKAGFEKDEIKLLSKLIAVYEEWTKTQPAKEPVDPNAWDPDKEENAALFKAFKAYAEGFYYAIDPEGQKTSRKQNLGAQSKMVRNLRKTLKAVLKAEAEEAGDKQMAGFAAPDPEPVNEQEGEEPRKLSINNLKASLNMFQSLLSKLDDYLIRWLNAAKKNLKIQREHKRSLIKLIERVQAFAKKIYDFGMDIVKVPEPQPTQASPQITRNPNLREYVELNQDTIMDATKQVQKVHEKVKDAFLNVILPATKDRNRPYDEVKRACVEVDKELVSILKFFSQLTKFGEKSGDDVTFDKIQARYKKAFKNLNIPFAIVKRMDDEFIVGKSDPGTIEQTMLEIKDFSVELENIFGVDGIPEEAPEPERSEIDKQTPEEGGISPEDWLNSPDSDNDGLSDEEEEQIGTNSEEPDTDGDGEEDATEPEAQNLPINSFAQLSSRLIPLFRRPNIAQAITNLGIGAPRPSGNTKLNNLAKFLAYYLVYKKEKTPVQEMTVQQAPMALGMSKKMSKEFITWLNSNDKEIFEWFKGSFKKENVRKYIKFFDVLGKDEMFNSFDLSSLSLSAIKQQVSKAKKDAPKDKPDQAEKPAASGDAGEAERDNEIKAEIDKIASSESLAEFGSRYEDFRIKYAPDRLPWSEVEAWFSVPNATPEDIAMKISAAGTGYSPHRQKLSDLIKADRAKGPDPADAASGDAEKTEAPAQSDPAQAPAQPEPQAPRGKINKTAAKSAFKKIKKDFNSFDVGKAIPVIRDLLKAQNVIYESFSRMELANNLYKAKAVSAEEQDGVAKAIISWLSKHAKQQRFELQIDDPNTDFGPAKAIRTAAKKVVARGQAEAPHVSLSSEEFINAATEEAIKAPEVKKLTPDPEEIEVEKEVLDVILDDFGDALSPEEKADIEQKLQADDFWGDGGDGETDLFNDEWLDDDLDDGDETEQDTIAKLKGLWDKAPLLLDILKFVELRGNVIKDIYDFETAEKFYNSVKEREQAKQADQVFDYMLEAFGDPLSMGAEVDEELLEDFRRFPSRWTWDGNNIKEVNIYEDDDDDEVVITFDDDMTTEINQSEIIEKAIDGTIQRRTRPEDLTKFNEANNG